MINGGIADAEAPSDEKGGEAFRAVAFPALFFVLGLAARFLPWRHVFSSGGVYLYDPDCYVRLRKILIYLKAFPKTSVYDYFQGYPVGTGILSPPTMEYLVGALLFPFRHLPVAYSICQGIVVFVPPLIGAFTVLAVYIFARRTFGVVPAVAAALTTAIAPELVEASCLGRFDNEMIEPLLLLLTVSAYSKTYYTAKSGRSAVMTGIMTAVYLCVWRGAIFPLSVIGIDMLLRILSPHQRDASRYCAGKVALCLYLTPAFIVSLICLGDIWGTRAEVSFNTVSWFQVILFAAAGGFLFLLAQLRQREGAARAKAAAAMVVLAALVAALTFIFRQQLGAGISVVSGGNTWIDSITEYQSGILSGDFFTRFGGSVILIPVGLYLLFTRFFADIPTRRLIAVWTLLITVASLARVRYAEYLPLNIAVLAAVTVAFVQERNRAARGLVPTAFTPAVVAVLLLCQLPTFPFFSNMYRGGMFRINGDIEDTMLWLRDHTPPAGDYLRPQVKPAYGVLARWDYGGYIETIAQRPSVATNYGTETYGMEAAARFFLSRSDQELESVLSRNGVRYIVVDKVMGDLPMYARLIGSRMQFYEEQRIPGQQTTMYVPTPESLDLVVSRLFFTDGSLAKVGELVFRPVEDLRLVYESKSPADVEGFPLEVKKMKVFEYAKGGEVIVRGAPGLVATFALPIETNQGRRFVYRNSKRIGSDGTAHFKLLYAPKKQPDTTGAIGPAQLGVAGKTTTVSYDEKDVNTGRTIHAL